MSIQDIHLKVYHEFTVMEYDPAYSALLNLPSLQTKLRIPCMCNCILLELKILPCNNVHSHCTLLTCKLFAGIIILTKDWDDGGWNVLGGYCRERHTRPSLKTLLNSTVLFCHNHSTNHIWMKCAKVGIFSYTVKCIIVCLSSSQDIRIKSSVC